jgi:hypothetical protein
MTGAAMDVDAGAGAGPATTTTAAAAPTAPKDGYELPWVSIVSRGDWVRAAAGRCVCSVSHGRARLRPPSSRLCAPPRSPR